MAQDFGSGVTRTLDASERQFTTVVWRDDKPPTDAEMNLVGQIAQEAQAQSIRAAMASGFFLDPTRSQEDFEFNPNWSNLFVLGKPRLAQGVQDADETTPVLWANVNGWAIPVAGTKVSVNGDLRNLLKLSPPPASDARVDFVFLEVWQTLVRPNPSVVNKPSASTIYKYGNVEYGGTQVVDDLEYGAFGFETTGRIQLQYRLRIFGQGAAGGSSTTLQLYPDGLGDPNIYSQGAAAAPLTSGGASFLFENMREKLGDPGLWRSGNGDPNNALGTVDGYSYAVPVCAIFRRNSNVYVGVASSGNPNQNGAFNRNPGASFLVDPRTGAKPLLTASLTAALSATATGSVNITNLNGSGLEDDRLTLTSTFIVIDGEVLGISAVDAVGGTITIPALGRGRYGSDASGHAAGAVISFFNTRPDGLFADQIASGDVLDLRRGCNSGDWDYQRLLQHNVGALADNTLRTAWKVSGAGDSEGPVVQAVDYLHADGGTANPNHTDALDGPDGVRTIWSDAACLQPDVTLLLDNEATLSGGFTTLQFDSTVGWDVGADFKPNGFLNLGAGGPSAAWTNGSTVFLHSGGEDGAQGARGTFRAGSTRAVRFVAPRELWKSGYPVVDPTNGNQHPVSIRFLDQRSTEPVPFGEGNPSRHPGPQYPWRESNFERPFIFLGGLLRTDLKKADRADTNLYNVGGGVYEIDAGVNFDTSGAFFLKDANGEFLNDPAQITSPLSRGLKTLYGMLTDNGRDRTGASSEVYVVLYGDDQSTNNNGCFKVLGCGTAGYTSRNGASASRMVVQPLSADFGGFDVTGQTLTLEFRSQDLNSDDPGAFDSASPDACICLTDIGGLGVHPWTATTLGPLALPIDVGSGKVAVESKMAVNLTLLYHPGRGGFSRVPDQVDKMALRSANSTYLRQSGATLDTTFAAFSGTPTNETQFDPVHVQTWNRLPGLGWPAPLAPNYGGNVVGFTEQDREHELFFDKGSKTLLWRPFRDRQMTVKGQTTGASPSLIGSYTYPSAVAKDAGQIFTGTPSTGKLMGYPLPPEFMPRFGRQDIPYFRDINAGAGTFLEGINHLFRDHTNLTDPVFGIIGGEDNISGGLQVKPIFFRTGTPADFGEFGTVIGPVSNTPYYEGRKVPSGIDPNDSDGAAIIARLAGVHSSDLGSGLKGIQLPPYLGIARLYGVYDRRDFEAKGGRTYLSNRVTLEADPATNLLRKDASQQTLFILQDGAKDLTGEAGDHTYIIPSNVLDITRSPNFVPGEVFDDLDYVLVATVFGFSKGWINENNIVLTRRHNSAGTLISDGDDLELEDMHMILPSPASFNDQAYVAYTRTVYQGDPYMTRGGEAQTTSDYENRYGQISSANAFALATPIEQFDADGALQIETPNARGFEVLASMDFYTTLGTGKVGGRVYPGTSLDSGFTEPGGSSRIPSSGTAPSWKILPRAFTEGQKANTSRAIADLDILANDSINPSSLSHAVIRFGLLDGTILDLYGSTAAHQAALTGSGVAAANIYTVDERGLLADVQIVNETVAFGVFTTQQIKTFTFGTGAYAQLAGIKLGDAVTVNPRSALGTDGVSSVVLEGFVSDQTPGAEVVTVKATYTGVDQPYSVLPDPNAIQTAFNFDFADMPTGTSLSTILAFPGALTTDGVVVSAGGLPDGVWVDASCEVNDQIELRIHNFSGGNYDPPNTIDYIVSLLRAQARLGENIGDAEIDIQVARRVGNPQITAQNLTNLINGHADLQRTATAITRGSNRVTVEAIPVGAEGNNISLSLRHTGEPTTNIQSVLRLDIPRSNIRALGANITRSPLHGGLDIRVNAGSGTSQLALTGMTERLPLGILLQDADFMCENPLGDTASAMQSAPAGIRPIQTLLPLTNDGGEATRFIGKPGEMVALSDGRILGYTAYTTATPTGTKRFRIYRGGGAAFVLSGKDPGGPVDWVSESFPPSLQPVLKGGVLVCKALLVKNFYEEALSSPLTFSEGGEIQMIILTYGILGNGQVREQGLTLSGLISPTGYGEGYAAADRYRIMGRPMFRQGQNRNAPDASGVSLSPFIPSE